MKKTTILVITCLMSVSLTSTSAFAFGKPQAGGNDFGAALFDTALSLAILYGQADPRISPVLAALGIRSAADLKKLLSGDKSGSNIGDIVSFALMNYAAKNPKIQAVLDQLGAHDFNAIQGLLSGSGDNSVLFQLGYDFISHNDQYANWLSTLGIANASDLAKLFQGGVSGGTLQDLLFRIGTAFLISKGKFNAGDLFSGVHLGSFQGLPVSEISKIVQASKTARASKH